MSSDICNNDYQVLSKNQCYCTIDESTFNLLSPNALKLYLLLELSAKYGHRAFEEIKQNFGLPEKEFNDSINELLSLNLIKRKAS